MSSDDDVFKYCLDDRSPKSSAAILDWNTVHRRMRWNAMFQIGGAFALADAFKVIISAFPRNSDLWSKLEIHSVVITCLEAAG